MDESRLVLFSRGPTQRAMQDNAEHGRFLPLGGHDSAAMDARGRIPVPKMMRDSLGEKFVLRIGIKGCLEAISFRELDRIWEEIERHSPHSEARQDYAVEVMMNMWHPIQFDKTGRFVVPEAAKVQGNLKEAVFLRSRGDAVEIWAQEEYDAYNKDTSGYRQKEREKMRLLRRAMLEDDAQ